jgi:hypothetical protein
VSKKSIFFLLFILFSLNLFSQDEEVLLTFKYSSVGNVYVGCLYDSQNDKSYLPIAELFSLFEVNYAYDAGSFSIKGYYLDPEQGYSVNLASMVIRLGDDTRTLSPDDFRVGEMDYYLSPELFLEIFGLDFTVNISYLMLTLETSHKLPVEERIARERNRSRMGSTVIRQDYPLGYGRKRHIINGGLLDYAFTGTVFKQTQMLNYTLTGGMEILGGDIQGTLTGNINNLGNQGVYTNGIRWRYGILNNKYISAITAGQIITSGLLPLSIIGAGLSNEPIEPRETHESYIIDGTTEPEAEVEIYVNDQLTDYQRADEMGYYRFKLPIMYGTTRISLKIYTRSGELRVINRQMQVPFTFLPRGTVSYNVQAGQSDNNWFDTLQRQYISHADISVGLSRWLTTSAGIQNTGNSFLSGKVYYYSSTSARIAGPYLLNLDIAPNAFYRLTGSVTYMNNLSLNLIYTRFDGFGQFNQSGYEESYLANIYIPFKFFGLNSGFRLDGEYTVFANGQLTRYSADYSLSIRRANLRFNYRDNVVRSGGFTYFGEGLLTTSLTYTISRAPGVPLYINGMFIRGQLLYDIRHNNLKSAELRLSKTILRSGRINLSTNYNFDYRDVYVELGLTLDLKPFRSTTTLYTASNSISARQSIYGSVGLDARNGHVEWSNRQQTGRSAAAVLLFVDNNNSGKYDKNDERLPYRGVNLDKSSIMQVGRDSILRITQLQSYYLYNLKVNRGAIDDPTLVPLKDKFSFIADPNQYKRIEIPFYRGGIIEGTVIISRNGIESGLGGLRVLLKGLDHEYQETLRSFNDGGFYTMDLPPGRYSLEVDPAQLDFLGAVHSDKIEFEIKAVAEGDYVEGLIINIIQNAKP